MVFRQITQDDLGCASYLIGDATAERELARPAASASASSAASARFDVENRCVRTCCRCADLYGCALRSRHVYNDLKKLS
jgi:hypothetical protein